MSTANLRSNGWTHDCCQGSCAPAQVIPLYCFDPRQFDRTPFGNPKTGAFRAKFLLESVMALRARLRGLGSDLLIANGRPEDVLTGADQRKCMLAVGSASVLRCCQSAATKPPCSIPAPRPSRSAYHVLTLRYAARAFVVWLMHRYYECDWTLVERGEHAMVHGNMRCNDAPCSFTVFMTASAREHSNVRAHAVRRACRQLSSKGHPGADAARGHQ